jgi:glycerol-3-phosphate acyltransferase PlsY
VFELAKGAAGPALAGPARPVLRAVAAGLAVTGHNWSPFLRGAGGRGVSPAAGALLVVAPEGALLLLGGMGVGRLLGETAVGSLAADLALVPVVATLRGRRAALVAAAVVVPILLKRLAGNHPPARANRREVLWNRFVLDRDERRPARQDGLDAEAAHSAIDTITA